MFWRNAGRCVDPARALAPSRSANPDPEWSANLRRKLVAQSEALEAPVAPTPALPAVVTPVYDSNDRVMAVLADHDALDADDAEDAAGKVAAIVLTADLNRPQ